MTVVARAFALITISSGVLLAAGPSSPRRAPAGQPAPSHMAEHFSTAKAMQEAVIRGDLDDARKAAKWMADHQTDAGIPASRASLVTAIKGLAQVAAEAPQLNVASSAVARMAATCGTCHASMQAKLPLDEMRKPDPGSDPAAHMRNHQGAVDYMYHGLTAPSDEAWEKGADALSTATLMTKLAGADANSTQRMAALEARVHELADRARRVSGTTGRAAIYAELLSGCGECHGQQGRVLGPGAPK